MMLVRRLSKSSRIYSTLSDSTFGETESFLTRLCVESVGFVCNLMKWMCCVGCVPYDWGVRAIQLSESGYLLCDYRASEQLLKLYSCTDWVRAGMRWKGFHHLIKFPLNQRNVRGCHEKSENGIEIRKQMEVLLSHSRQKLVLNYCLHMPLAHIMREHNRTTYIKTELKTTTFCRKWSHLDWLNATRLSESTNKMVNELIVTFWKFPVIPLSAKLSGFWLSMTQVWMRQPWTD